MYVLLEIKRRVASLRERTGWQQLYMAFMIYKTWADQNRPLKCCETLYFSNILPAPWAVTVALWFLSIPSLWSCVEVFKQQHYGSTLHHLHNSTLFSVTYLCGHSMLLQLHNWNRMVEQRPFQRCTNKKQSSL